MFAAIVGSIAKQKKNSEKIFDYLFWLKKIQILKLRFK
jgi:hypothetical protein